MSHDSIENQTPTKANEDNVGTFGSQNLYIEGIEGQGAEAANGENLEEVRHTLRRIELEKKMKQNEPAKREGRAFLLRVLMVIFFPVSITVLCVKVLFRRVKLTISAKTTVVFTLLFSGLLGLYIFIIAVTLFTHIRSSNDPESYILQFYIISACLVLVFVVAGATLGSLVSHILLSPLRKTIDEVRQINEDNLDKRLPPLSTKDELSDLTDIINAMLKTLQSSFEQQAHFVSDASHELKTPLSIIQGYASLLERWGKNQPELLDEGIDAIAREANNMKKIVEQLLLLAKLGDFTLHYSEVEIMQLVEDTVGTYKILELTHTINFRCGEATIIETDKSLLVEALRTLIDNAIKYTKSDGIIDINCQVDKDGVQITVADNGIGISERDLPHIFDRFYRCDRARREKGSTGLGLTIAKSIIEMMEGTLTVQSKPNQGSKFTVRLPQ